MSRENLRPSFGIEVSGVKCSRNGNGRGAKDMSMIWETMFLRIILQSSFGMVLLKFIHVVNNDTIMHAVHTCTVASSLQS